MSLRLGSPNDLDSLMDIERESFQEDQFDRDLTASLLHDEDVITVVYEEDAILGYGMIRLSAINEVGEIISLAVMPRVRGKGIGKRLLVRMEDIARNEGVLMITLCVHVENAAALHLYQVREYVALATYYDYYGPNKDAVVMMRSLEMN